MGKNYFKEKLSNRIQILCFANIPMSPNLAFYRVFVTCLLGTQNCASFYLKKQFWIDIYVQILIKNRANWLCKRIIFYWYHTRFSMMNISIGQNRLNKKPTKWSGNSEWSGNNYYKYSMVDTFFIPFNQCWLSLAVWLWSFRLVSVGFTAGRLAIVTFSYIKLLLTFFVISRKWGRGNFGSLSQTKAFLQNLSGGVFQFNS